MPGSKDGTLPAAPEMHQVKHSAQGGIALPALFSPELGTARRVVEFFTAIIGLKQSSKHDYTPRCLPVPLTRCRCNGVKTTAFAYAVASCPAVSARRTRTVTSTR